MRITRALFLSKSIRDELNELRTKRSNGKTISDFLIWLYKEKNFSLLESIKHFNENRRLIAISDVNKFFEPDFNRLGPELHAATYTLKLGGRCRLYGSPRWLSLEDKKLSDVLPQERVSNFHVEGLDLSRTVIKSDGISNIESCYNLKTLLLNNCFYNDDWLLARISNAFSNSLENLDISECQNVSDNGLLTLGHLRKLKNLNLSNLKGVKSKEYISILLEDNLEGLVITGVDHLSETSLQKVEKTLQEEDSNLKNIIKNSNL